MGSWRLVLDGRELGHVHAFAFELEKNGGLARMMR